MATMGVIMDVPSISVATAKLTGNPMEARTTPIMGATEAAGPMAAIPVRAEATDTWTS